MSIIREVDATIVDEYGFSGENTPMGELRSVEPVRMVGASFEGSAIDSNFWVTAATGSGAAIAQANGLLTLTSGTANAASVTSYSARRSRYIGGTALRYRAIMVLGDTGTVNNTRRWGIGWSSSGMPTITDGAYFKLSGTTFSVNTMEGGVETSVTSFNGALGTSFPLTTNFITYEIYWTTSKVYFVIGDVILHSVTSTIAPWANTKSHYVFMNSLNSGVITLVTMSFATSTIYSLGKNHTATIFKHLTSATAVVLKYGLGTLHRIVFNTFGNGASVTLYDALTATNPICITAPPNNTYPGSIEYQCDFYVGLTITITGTVDVTIVYE